ncbi:MAG: hypothetical protein OXP69_14405 [Spirochaetaceae bacterium]|nr:hypothetical protein [Spirochaetaceae bacterium]
MSTESVTQMPTSDLGFDRHNPRLVEFKVTSETTDEELIQLLWDTMDVYELVLSIAASGFFPHEALIVAREASKHVVIEGNRRLAAVRVLLKPDIIDFGNVTIPELSIEARDSLRELPVLLATRQDSWRHLGFKHVNGPARWGSYAKSRYIADVHRKYGVPLDDIAQQIGDTHRTVQRLYRALMVLEQAEELNVFDRSDRFRTHFSFSHLFTGVEYPAIGEFIGLQAADDEATCPVMVDKKEELGELLRWMYGSKKESHLPVIERQNPDLRRLAAVLGNRESVAALRDGVDLEFAFEISRPSSTVFEEALLAAKRHLQKAHGLLTTGYTGSQELLRITGSVVNLAYDLYEEMERKHKPRTRGRIADRE